MRIQGLGVIDDATLDLAPGLNVLTGETGAGKTMVVTGLGLLLGARSDAGAVRHGTRAAVVEGVVEVAPEHPARERVRVAGGEADDDLLLARTVSAEGRSRAHVGGRQAPVALLGELGELLVAVHGQADQWRLRRPEQHRILLDDFGGKPLAAARAAYEATFADLAGCQAALREALAAGRERDVVAQELRDGLEELERLDPRPGEDEELATEQDRLAHADALRTAAGLARDQLTGGDDPGAGGAAGVLATTAETLEATGSVDPRIGDLARRAAELALLAADLGEELSAYLDSLEADPARLAAVSERRADLARLARRRGGSVQEALAWGRDAAARLAALDGAADRAKEVRVEAIRLQEQLGAQADELSAMRGEAADRLARAVTDELAHLAMGRARVEVAVERQDDTRGLPLPGGRRVRFGPSGADTVEIRLAANPGAPPRSVARAASGGELSRVMLALEVVTAAPDDGSPHQLPTFVFDEVDAGIGGAAALDVGARLAALARHAQVLVVTHLPQVAAYADRHLVVHKESDGHVTSSGVIAVTGQERLAELARMMAGAHSEVALAHAGELLDQARRRSAR